MSNGLLLIAVLCFGVAAYIDAPFPRWAGPGRTHDRQFLLLAGVRVLRAGDVSPVNLQPMGDPPDRSARWCPSCGLWITNLRGRRRCGLCHTAVVRPPFRSRPRPGELRPGIVAEFDDPRDTRITR